MDNSTDSISEWLGRLKAGEAEAAQKLWNRYSAELVLEAKKRLGKSPRAAADEDDVALSVFDTIFRGAAEGRFDHISTRDELWWLLLTVAKQKTVDHIRRETAHKRHHRPEPARATEGIGAAAPAQTSLNDLVSSTPTPDFLVALEEQYVRLLKKLGKPQLQEIAVLRIQGYNVAEIAQKMGVGQRAIERKLQLIRSKWKYELLEADPGQ